MQLHYKTFGQGQPLIVLHGLFGSLDNWHSINLKLSEHFQVFAVDQRNHGQSPHHPEISYPLLAQDLQEFMRHHRLAYATVLGHSMGGKTAMQLALCSPDLVERLIVVDIAPRAYAPRHHEILAALLSLNLQAYQTRRQVEEALAPAIPNLALRRFLLKSLAPDPAGGFRWKMGLQHLHQNYPLLAAGPAPCRPFDKPALFVRGENSDYVCEEDLPLIRRWFPHAQIRAVPAAGHWLHAENPGAFLEIVLGFLLAK